MKNALNLKKLIFLLILLISISNFSCKTTKVPIDTGKINSSEKPVWVDMMNDPNANFFETQKAFDSYWKNRKVEPGSGYNVYKRWESFMQNKIDKKGSRSIAAKGLVSYTSFLQNTYKRSLVYNGNWSLLGPVNTPSNSTFQPNGLGRLNTVAFHPADSNIIYVGAASGGFWISKDGGFSWECKSNNMPTQEVSSILVFPNDPSVILMGTGDRDYYNNLNQKGVYKSVDGGDSWTASNTGMGDMVVGKMIMYPGNSNIILAATNTGIYKSANGGTTWAKKTSGTKNFKDMSFNPGNADIVYSTENGKFYRSADAGETWVEIISGIVSGTRMVIGVTSQQPSWVYLLQTNSSFSALLKSTDDGQTFITQSTSPNIMDNTCLGDGAASQGWYDLAITIDPDDANTIYAGGVNIWKSLNGGINWAINAHWVGSCGVPAIHSDVHSLNFSPLTKKIYASCDGGLFYSPDKGSSWKDISSGLAISQIYRIGQSITNNELVINGYIDNGTALADGDSFNTIIGGDGLNCLIDFTDPNYYYGSTNTGRVTRFINGTSTYIAYNGFNGINESGCRLITPFVLHETDPNIMFVGYSSLWRGSNIKNPDRNTITWKKISSFQDSYPCIGEIEQSPANTNLFYVYLSGLKLYRSENIMADNPDWILCNLPSANNISDIEAHPTDENILYAAGYNNIYKSTDKGNSWQSIKLNLPNIIINCVVIDKNSDNEALYIGTQAGVFYKDNSMAGWISFNQGLPVIEVTDLEVYYGDIPANSRIKAGTYGRGLWSSELYYMHGMTLSTGILSGDSFCAGDSINIPFKCTGTFGDANVFTAQLSDINGNFGSPIELGTLNSNTFGNIKGKFPSVLTSGSAYRIRVVSSDPNIVGLTNNTNLTVDYLQTPVITVNNSCGKSDLIASNYSGALIWSTGENTPGISVTTPGSYSLIQKSENGCTSNTAAALASPLIIPDVAVITSSQKICRGASSTLTASGASTYLWNDGTTVNPKVVSPISTTTYTVTGSSSGCSASANLTVNVDPMITLSASSNPICKGASSILTANGESSASLTYTWCNSLGTGSTKTVAPTATTTYTVSGKNSSNNCTNTASIIINVSIPTITANASPIAVCKGSSTSLTAGGASTYSWSGGLGSGNPVIATPTVTTTYTVTGTDINNCSNTKTINVVVNPLPTITVTATPTSIKIGRSSTLKATGASTYSWSHGLGAGAQKTVSPTVTTIYTVTGTSNLGCSSIKAISVVVNP